MLNELKEEIISYLLLQPGILSCLLRRHTALGQKVAAWFIGDAPILLIGGEPGNGKSLFMGDLVIQYGSLARLYPALQAPLALISYDRVHYLFLERLMELKAPEHRFFLPEGETHPEARQLITRILQDVLLFAVHYLSRNTRIILEAPLIGSRGENLIETLHALRLYAQVFIMHSPAMWVEMLRQQPERGTSARALAMEQIHRKLLQQWQIPADESVDEDQALKRCWEQRLSNDKGMVLSWNPSEDQASYLHTREMLRTQNIAPDPLAPEALQQYASFLINQSLQLHPDLDGFAFAVQQYHHLSS